MSSKKIVVTGASRGIGLELVKQLADIGHQVLALSRNTSGIEPILTNQEHITFLQTDITESKGLTKIVDFIKNDNETIKTMRNAKKIYGEKVGEKIMDWLLEEMEKKVRPFSWAHERIYGLDPVDEETVDFM